MVTANLIGGCGNQLFQAAAAIAHAKRVGVDWGIPDRTWNETIWPMMIPANLPRYKLWNFVPAYREPSHAYTPIPENYRHIRLDGYFQSYKYFEDYIDEIRQLFGFVSNAGMNAVSIHVRRGDYLAPMHLDKHPVVTLDYLNQAIEMFPDDEFLVFSDDLAWCHKNFKGDRFHFSEGNNTWLDLRTMALCKHNIISNSTFSWWAAYMNCNPDKIVVTPDESNWFGPANKHLDVKDLIPTTWQRIKY